MLITAAQLRAARGLLDWTRTDLAKAAGISPETIKNIEHGTFRPQEATAEAIIRAFALHGVKFLQNEGVEKSTDSLMILNGLDDFKSFMDDLYAVARQDFSLNGEKPICVCNIDNKKFKAYLGDYASSHIKRMMDIKGLEIKALANKVDDTHVEGANYLIYKYLEKVNDYISPFYVYGDKFAIINFNSDDPPRIIVIDSFFVAQSYREQFNVMWNEASFELPE